MRSFIEFPNLFSGLTIHADRIAFSIFGLDVYWYGIIITTAVVLGILYAIKSAKTVGLIPDNVFEMAFWGVLAGVAGARLYFVIFSGEKYDLITAIVGIRDGGLAIYGGIIGSVIGASIVAKLSKIKFAPFADLVGAGFLLGQGIGRWGNFFNQEAFGKATASNLPWGMTGDIINRSPAVMAEQSTLGSQGYALVHPCFLYESLWCLLGFALLYFYTRKLKSFDGEVFLLYVAWYGTGRALIEPLRTDSLMLGNLKVSLLLAIASAVFALGVFVYFKFILSKKRIKDGKGAYVLYKDTEESKQRIDDHINKVKLDKEKEDAKSELKKINREMNDPFADGVSDDGEKDTDDVLVEDVDDDNDETVPVDVNVADNIDDDDNEDGAFDDE